MKTFIKKLILALMFILSMILFCVTFFNPPILTFIFFSILIYSGFKLGEEKRLEKRRIEEEEKEAFRNQKTKVKLISGYWTSDVEKEVNKFIRDKKVLNVTFDDNRSRVTATILYEEI